MNFLKKMKNNNGSAESAMFVFGVMIFATVVIFALSIFGLTWQRYLSSREISNMSRLYAIRSRTMYYDGTQQIAPEQSKFVEEMKRTIEGVVQHTQVKSMYFEIHTDEAVKLFEITATNNGQDVTSEVWIVDYEHFKEVDYGDPLISTMKVEYVTSTFRDVADTQAKVESYELSNRFAFEQKASNTSVIG